MGKGRPAMVRRVFGPHPRYAKALYDKDVGRSYTKGTDGKRYANAGQGEAARRAARMAAGKAPA